MTSPLATCLTGLLFGLSLIVAIGAQNLFVLREGLRRTHVLVVVFIAAGSDVLLIAAGVAGLGTVIEGRPGLLTAARIGGAGFLAYYATRAGLRAWKPAHGDALQREQSGPARRTAVLTMLVLTWLNPHVYLDTVVLLGSISATHGNQRWWFGAGAMLASIGWFFALGYGARLLGPLFARPVAWRWLDASIAGVMLAIAASLVLAL